MARNWGRRTETLLAVWLVSLAALLPISATGVDGVTSRRDTANPAAPLVRSAALPIPRFSDVEADPRHHRAFISGGQSVDDLLVVSESGDVIDTLEVPDAQDLTLDPDQQTLWVAQSAGEAVVAIDLSTFEQTRYPVGDGICPTELAVTLDLVWFTADCRTGVPSLRVLDPSTGSVTDTGLEGAAMYDAAPGRPRLLVGAESYWITTYRLTGGPQPSAVQVTRRQAYDAVQSIALMPNGRRVVAADSGSTAEVYDTSDLSEVDAYPSSSFTRTVAVSEDGAVAVGTPEAGVIGDQYEPYTGLFVYAPGVTGAFAPYRFYEQPDDPEGGVVDYDGLAWGSDVVFVVLATDRAGPRLSVVDGGAPPRPATGRRHLTLPRFGDMEADPATGRVFLTQGPGGNGVAVLNERARVQRILQHLPGADQMVLDRRRHVVWVALSHGDAVASVDTRTLRVRRFPTGPETCPGAIALAGGRVWFGFGCGPGFGGGLGTVSPGSGRVRLQTSPVADSLVVDPTDDRTLWGLWRGGSSAEVYQWRLPEESGRARLRDTAVVGSYMSDLAATPDGLHLVLASQIEDHHAVLDTRTLRLVGLEPTRHSALAAEVRTDGLVAAGSGATEYTPGPVNSWSVRLFGDALGGRAGHDLSVPGRNGIVPRGLEVAGRRVVLARSDGAGLLRLQVRRLPAIQPVTLTADRRVLQGQRSVRLVVRAIGPARGAQIVVRRLGRRVAAGAADRNGNLELRLRKARAGRYVAVARGDDRVWRSSLRLVKPGG